MDSDKNANGHIPIQSKKSKFFKAGRLAVATSKLSRVGPYDATTEFKRRRISRSLRESKISESHLNGFARTNYVMFSDLEDDVGDENVTLWQAVRLGKLHKVTQYVLESFPLDKKDEQGMAALHYAAFSDQSEIARLLLENGASVDSLIKQYKMTPLHVAAKNNSTNIAKVLIRFGSNIYAKDTKGATPLHIAGKHGWEKIVEILLACQDANINVQDNDNLTPLHQAARSGSAGVCKLLVEHGADIRCKDINDSTPLMKAASGGHTDVMSILLEAAMKRNIAIKEYIEDADNEGSTAIHLAVGNSHLKATKLCLDHGVDVDIAKSCNAYTPLQLAAVYGHTDIANLLIQRGAQINARDSEHMTPLHRASLYNQVEMMKFLLSKGACLDARDSEHFTPLLVTAWKGQSDAALFLLSEHANLEAFDSSGKTCLHWAVEGDHVQYVTMLLGNGAKVLLDMKDSKDQTPVHYVAENGNLEMLNVLIDNGANLCAKDGDEKMPLHIASQYGRLECVEALVRANPKHMNADDVDDRTPLLLASLNGHCKVVTFLLKIGADISSRDDDRMSALALAASEGHCDTVLTLLKHHADIDAVDKNKNTALHHSAGNGHAEVTRLLLSNGADVTLENDSRRNALEVAIEKIQEDTAKAIMEHESWQESLVPTFKNGATPMKLLIEKLPDVAMIVLDNCLEYSHIHREHPDLKVKHDYRFIDTDPDNVDTKSRWSALMTMVECERESLLKHELCQQLLKSKWKRFAGYLFFVDFITYIAFLVLLTVYAASNPRILSPDIDGRGCPTNDSRFYDSNGNPLSQPQYLLVIQCVISVFCIIQLLKEIFELFNQRLGYFLSCTNYVELLLYASSIGFMNPISQKPCDIQWEAGSVAIFLAWLVFILYVRMFHFFGIYVVMFFTVLKSLIKAVILLILFVVAFGSSFSIILGREEAFANILDSILKVFVMTIGEIDYVDIFHSGISLYPFNTISHVLFVIFLFLMPIVLMNLLVGIAVGDIDKIQQNAELGKIEIEVLFTGQIENNVPKWIQRKFYLAMETTEPNKLKKMKFMKLKRLLVRQLKNEEAIDAENKRNRDSEKLERMQKEIDQISKRQTVMTTMMEEQVNLTKVLCNKMNLNSGNDYDLPTYADAL
ncbi:transient receptor potential cation channel subfamily A member 1-like [Glandiceps talaboti]